MRRLLSRALVIGCSVAVSPVGILAQRQALPAFDVSSVRLSPPDSRSSHDGSVRTVMSGTGELGDLTRTTVTARSRYSLTVSKDRTQILNGTRMAMGDFAVLLERVIGEPVLDRTSLDALYKFTIELPLDNTMRQALMRGAALFGGSPSDSPFAASPLPMVSDGLKGLGLRMERRRSQIETIVVDRIERTPTAN